MRSSSMADRHTGEDGSEGEAAVEAGFFVVYGYLIGTFVCMAAFLTALVFIPGGHLLFLFIFSVIPRNNPVLSAQVFFLEQRMGQAVCFH